MKYAVIDIGSNSVRLMMHDGIKTLSKQLKITRLAENMSSDNRLTEQAMQRTAYAVSDFVSQARGDGTNKLYVFATAATRLASNRDRFLQLIKELCDVDVDVISGEHEAKIGVKGALGSLDGGTIDIGGASTEITVIQDGINVYTKSLNVGVVVIKDKCGQDHDAITDFLAKKVKEYGVVPKAKFYGIGGTATTIASVMQELEVYDPKKVHGYVVAKSALKTLTDKLFSMSVEDRKKLKGLQPERAEVIAGGAEMLLRLFDLLKIDEITVSESDNLEGYLAEKREKDEKTY